MRALGQAPWQGQSAWAHDSSVLYINLIELVSSVGRAWLWPKKRQVRATCRLNEASYGTVDQTVRMTRMKIEFFFFLMSSLCNCNENRQNSYCNMPLCHFCLMLWKILKKTFVLPTACLLTSLWKQNKVYTEQNPPKKDGACFERSSRRNVENGKNRQTRVTHCGE